MHFATPPIKRWKLFPNPLSLGWPYDLIWPREFGRSNRVSVLNLDLNRSWLVLLSLSETFHWYVRYLMLENDERSCGVKPIYLSWGNPKPPIVSPPNIKENSVKINRPTYSTRCWPQMQATLQPRPENPPNLFVYLWAIINTLFLFITLSLRWFAMWYIDPAYLIAMRSPMWPEAFCLKSPSIWKKKA